MRMTVLIQRPIRPIRPIGPKCPKNILLHGRCIHELFEKNVIDLDFLFQFFELFDKEEVYPNSKCENRSSDRKLASIPLFQDVCSKKWNIIYEFIFYCRERFLEDLIDPNEK